MSARDDIMKDYVPVNERIAAFLAKHPDGSLQSELVELSETRVVMRAYAYRTPDDPRPGIGYSALEIPGRTPYTRGSEIENAETSSWGRAIAALGFEVKRGIASKEEVENKREERPAPPRLPAREDPAANEPPPGPYQETEELVGRLRRRGTIRKGTAEQYKLEGRLGPDGHVIGFRLEVAKDKHVPQCIVSGPVGEKLWTATGGHPETLIGTQATVSGILYYVRGNRSDTSWYRLHVDRFENDDWILTADTDPADAPVPEPVEAPTVPLFDDDEAARIDAALDKVPAA